MKKENKKLMVGIIVTILVVGLAGTGFFGSKALWWGDKDEADAAAPGGVPGAGVSCGDGVCHLPEYNAGTCPADCGTATGGTAPGLTTQPGLIYVDLSGNLMDKAKFTTDSSNAYSGINQTVKFFDITKNPQNDPRTNTLAVNDFQIIGAVGSGTAGALSGTKKGIAGHTYVYYFENTTGTFYDVTGTFTIPANINAFAPAFDFGNIMAPKVGSLTSYNESGDRTDNQDTDNGHRIYNDSAITIDSTTLTTDYRIQVGSQTYADFVRIWGEWSVAALKVDIIGVSAVQKAGPSTGITIDSSDAKNPIITINELTSMYPVTFTYYIQTSDLGTQDLTTYKIYADDWNAVPGKFASKIDSIITFDSA